MPWARRRRSVQVPVGVDRGPRHPPERDVRERQGRVGGAEDSHPLIDEADVAQPLAVADVVIGQDQEPLSPVTQ